MTKAYFTDYVKHCLRFYARHENPEFRNDTDKANWKACEKALNSFSSEDREILKGIYESRDTMADNVYQAATRLNVDQTSIWKMVNSLEHKVARERGLL